MIAARAVVWAISVWLDWFSVGMGIPQAYIIQPLMEVEEAAVDSVLSWIETHQGLAAWLGLLAPLVLWLALKVYRFLSSAVTQREKAQNIAETVEKAYSKLLDIAAAADSAGTKERFGLASLAHEQWDIVRSLEAASENHKLKNHLANAAEGVLAFQRAVIDWHGVDGDDDRQRNAGFAALENIKLASENLRKMV